MSNVLTTEEMDIVLSGYTIHDKAIKMIIDTINIPFVFHELLPVNENCSFSCWVKGTNGNSITFGTHTHTCNGNWQRIEETDIKNTTNRNFSMKFNNNGSYYFYRMKMEIGNKVTDYGKSQLDYWTTEQLISEISQTSSMISTKIKDLTNGRFTTIEQNVSGLTTRVGNAEGDITELEQSVTGLVTRVGNAEGDITTIEQNVSGLTTTVASKVGNNEIISKINQSSESITISANRLNLSGYLTITAGDSRYDASGSASTAESNAKSYASGVASTAESNAKTYADSNFDTKGSASTAESNAKTYADTNFDAKGSATSALNSAKTYADGQASTAESNAKTYADNNFDAKGSANAVKTGLANANYTTINGGNITTGIISGSGTGGSFSINFNTGVVNMQDGIFSGEINTGYGTIGGWTIDNDSITTEESSLYETTRVRLSSVLGENTNQLEAITMFDKPSVVSPYETRHFESNAHFNTYEIGINEYLTHGDLSREARDNILSSRALHLYSADIQDIDSQNNRDIFNTYYMANEVTMTETDTVTDYDRELRFGPYQTTPNGHMPALIMSYNDYKDPSEDSAKCLISPTLISTSWDNDNTGTHKTSKMTPDGFYAKGHDTPIGTHLNAIWTQSCPATFNNKNQYYNVATMALPAGDWMVHVMLAMHNTSTTAGMSWCCFATTNLGEYAPWLNGQYVAGGGTCYMNYSVPVHYAGPVTLYLSAKSSQPFRLDACYFEAIRVA